MVPRVYDVRRSDRVDQEMTLAFDFSIEEIAPLGIAYPDTVRLWHVCWLAHRSLPYVFTVAAEHAAPARCELLARCAPAVHAGQHPSRAINDVGGIQLTGLV